MVMSCNSPIFINQEKLIRETWLKDVIDGKYENIDYCIYRGDLIPKHKYKKETHELILRCEDDMNNTYKKTYYAFKLIGKIFKDYDYVFRTNTSTYVNIPVLNAFIQSLDRDDILYGGDLYSLSNAYCPYPLGIYARGNGMILSRNIIENIILKYGMQQLYLRLTDDIVIGNVFNSYWISEGENYLDHIKGFKHRWYKSIDVKDVEWGHQLSNASNDKDDFESCFDFITTQIKIYYYHNQHYGANKNRFDEIEEINYKEYNKVFNKIKFNDDILKTAVENNKQYSTNPSIFIGSVLGYIDYKKWEGLDKYKLFMFEITNKADDDPDKDKDKIWL